ncbi:MAG: GAF domain-containing protein [Bdellovibrionia bacterium]
MKKEQAKAKMEKRPVTPLEGELIAEIDEAADRLLFLSKVSQVLGRALTDKECFDHLLELVVPKLADWATLTIVNERDELQRVGTAHTDLVKRQLLKDLGNRYPPRIDDPTGPGFTIRNGKSEFVPDYGQTFDVQMNQVRYPELREILRTLRIRSKISVPISAHGRILGALWIATSDSGRVFNESDLKLAEEIASRAGYFAYHLIQYALASRKFERLQIEVHVREQLLSQLRHDVRSILSSALLSAQMIERSDTTKKNIYAKRIITAVQRATEILDKTKESALAEASHGFTDKKSA